jgi:hypothetical protein
MAMAQLESRISWENWIPGAHGRCSRQARILRNNLAAIIRSQPGSEPFAKIRFGIG